MVVQLLLLRTDYLTNAGNDDLPVAGTTTTTTTTTTENIVVKKRKRTKAIRLNQLVAHDHIGPRPSLNHVVDHINEVVQYNDVSNLQYLTYNEKSRKHFKRKKAKMDDGTYINLYEGYLDDHSEDENDILLIERFTKEKWRPLKDLDHPDENLSGYEGSNKGRIRNAVTLEIIKGTISADRYRQYDLLYHTRFGHRLIAFTWIEGYRKGDIVNHKNLKKRCNRVSNLEYLSQQQNVVHACGRVVTKRNMESNEEYVYRSVAECVEKKSRCIRSGK